MKLESVLMISRFFGSSCSDSTVNLEQFSAVLKYLSCGRISANWWAGLPRSRTLNLGLGAFSSLLLGPREPANHVESLGIRSQPCYILYSSTSTLTTVRINELDVAT